MSHPTIVTPTPGHTALTHPLQLTIPATIQPLINFVQHLPPAYHYTKHVQPPIHQMASDTLPPVPAQMRQKIIQDWTHQATGSECSRSTRSHPYMAHPVLGTLLVQYLTLGVAPSTRRMYQAGVRSYLQFFNLFNIVPFPASSLTLCYFCAHIACQVSHKTIKVYLSGVRLEHLECGLPDPTDDELLWLLCKGIKRSQGDTSRLSLPIPINILKVLKSELRIDLSYTLLEKRLLWSTFTLPFYGFLRASEFASSNLLWSNVELTPATVTIHLRQSKTDPFRCGQSIPFKPCQHLPAQCGQSTFLMT